jgi:hypothetical protein
MNQRSTELAQRTNKEKVLAAGEDAETPISAGASLA